MAASYDTTITLDGPKNTRVRFEGVLTSADIPPFTIIAQPSTLSDLGPFAGVKAKALRLDKIDYAIEDLLTITLFWDATVPVRICDLAGRGVIDNTKFFDWNNTQAAGWTGNITASSTGGAAGSALSFMINLAMTKQ